MSLSGEISYIDGGISNLFVGRRSSMVLGIGRNFDENFFVDFELLNDFTAESWKIGYLKVKCGEINSFVMDLVRNIPDKF